MNNQNNSQSKRNPEERVAHMNSIFDRLVLPMVAFTLVLFIGLGVIPKIAGCGEAAAPQVSEQDAQEDFYALRQVLLSDVAGNSALFEAAGYSVIEDSETGRLMPYRALASGAEIIENLCDSAGNVYSVIYRTDAESGRETNIMIYARSVFCVVVSDAEGSVSAIFQNEAFTPDETSSADAGQAAVLALAPSEDISALLEEYKQSLQSVVE